MAQFEMTAASAYPTWPIVCIVCILAGLLLVASVFYLLHLNRRSAEKSSEAIREADARLQASLGRIHELEIHNQQLAQIVRSYGEQVEDYALFAMNEHCQTTTWNHGVLRVLGFEESEFLGQDIRRLIFVPEAVELGIAQTEFELAAKRGIVSDDRWMMRKGGNRFWASGITSAIKDEQGNLVGFSKVLRDLTERKRYEDKLVELASKDAESNRRMNEFMAKLAHDLRNPLAPIRNALDLMGMSSLSHENEEMRLLLDRQVSQLIGMLDDLLDLSHSDGLGTGCEFNVCLPVAIATAEATPEEPAKEWPVCDRTFQVLVVEDMRALRTMMARLLEKLGHRVQVAEDGLSALESIGRITPEVIFSDISMPGMTGYDLAKRIRSLPDVSNIYLVAMSGYGQLSDLKMSQDSGFNEHMVKPIDIAKLRDFFGRLSR